MAANKQYPAIRFVIRQGNAVAFVVAAAIVLLGLYIGVAAGQWLTATVVIAVGVLAYLLLRTFAELVDVVADTLLPPE